MSRDDRVSVLRVENDDELARDGVVWARQVDDTLNNGQWHCIFQLFTFFEGWEGVFWGFRMRTGWSRTEVVEVLRGWVTH